ncbi:YciI family protein [Cupriavidus numazuensis]|uniref:YCII-related domain-containing protein n=1 Tax=Cupriavidus numazuensis TaxID=221992 RepID=A0ABM8TUU7_9BURK|nr:YciI family protein [Cupriavidus numazuensis]CAG2160381.1 hypothetical protein LMG26411_07443 [Cupriavidus numazuensis]
MFVVLLHYLQPLQVIETHLKEHRNYLDQHYAAGHFVASGPQVPRVGGVILVRGLSREQLDLVLADDPFYREQIAQYQVIEFHPNKFADGVESLFAPHC